MITVRGAGLTCVVDPAHGARLTSLVTDDGHEWLAPSSPPAPGEPFVRPGMGGWDEVAPTIQPDVTADGTALGDHGDVWDVEWRVLDAAPDRLVTAVSLGGLPVALTRTVSGTADGLRLDYRLTSPAPADVPVLWCGHPQFAHGDRATLVLECDGDSVRPPLREVYPGERARQLPEGPLHPSLPAGGSRKVFVDGAAVDAAVLTVDGRSLRMSWRADELPWLGLFWDNGEFAREPVIAVEPTTGWGDLRSAAIRSGRCLAVAAGRPLQWSIDLADVTGRATGRPSATSRGSQ